MRVIAIKRLREYWQKEPAAEQALRAWYVEAEEADWKTPARIKAKYGNESILRNGRVVFNICGNKYRLIVRISFDHATSVVGGKAFDKDTASRTARIPFSRKARVMR